MDIICIIKDKFDDGIINHIYSFLGQHKIAKLIENKVIDNYFDKLYQEYLDTYSAFLFGAR